jgi:hypothetical protein
MMHGRYIRRILSVFAICCAVTGPAKAENASAQTPPPALVAKYHQLKDQLAHSVFGSPILLNSTTADNLARGEVYALLEAPFAALSETLSQPAQWCELAILHINIKTCLYRADQVQFFVGRKHYQTPDEAFALQYHFAQLANDNTYLNIKLNAPDGPLGTSDYLINLEAIPIDAQHSFIRFEYRYRFGFMANIAMQTYLNTLGRNKVGFTIIGTDKNADPIFIKGLQGVIERNVMRYIFAIQSVLEARKSAVEYRHTAQLVRWYAHIQEHPKQLVELAREEYMHNKQRERSNQLEMQKALPP